MLRKFTQICSLALAATLIGCGGGGGGGTTAPVASTSTFQLLAIQAASFQQSATRPFSLSGTFNGVAISGSGSITFGSMTGATFETKPALQKTTVVTASFTANGTSYPLNTTSTSYVDTNYLPLGISGNEYVVVNGIANIPATALVNDTGTAFTATRYTDSTKTSQVGTATVTYALLPDTATTALLKITWVYRDNSSNVTQTDTSTSRITPTGSETPISETASYTNGNNLTISY